MKTKELWLAVKKVLFEEWDPIGINSNLACQEEYDSYATGIVRFLQEGADEHKIANHLRELQRVSMGLNAIDEERDHRVAQILVSLVR